MENDENYIFNPLSQISTILLGGQKFNRQNSFRLPRIFFKQISPTSPNPGRLSKVKITRRDSETQSISITRLGSSRTPSVSSEREEERREKRERTYRSPFRIRIRLRSCQSYVNPRCFFAALLIIDHLITIHYTLPPFFYFGTPSGRALFVHRGKPSKRAKQREERNFFFPSPGEGRPFAYRPPYRQIHRGRPS